ncbi:MAG TPA: succinyl-diaminopimelate desuccinylase [Acidimicrobiia bacterium]|nr:succinyl-diaminopimelate desuccinylase [Acidimicrobiia bacterium]
MTNPFLSLDPTNVLEVTKALINTESLSRSEDALCSALHEWIAQLRPDARMTRLSNTLIVHIGDHDADFPVVLAGHLDTVPAAQYEGALNNVARVVDEKLFGLGSADMKSGVAVMIALLSDISIASTFVFYEAEEIADKYNGLRLIVEQRPELVAGKWAILLEPTNGGLEMGCQGALTVKASFAGQRAHSARPWMGVNAIHKSIQTLAGAIEASTVQSELEVEGLRYTSTLQITMIEGGVAANVIPDVCDVTINHRYTPDVSPDEAENYLRELCSDADEVTVGSNSAGAMPAFDHPLVAFAKEQGREIVPKVAWTDVARFYALGIPAVNCGPGDAELCHRADEHIVISKLDETYKFLKSFIDTQK